LKKKNSKLLVKDIGEFGLIKRISKIITSTDSNVVVPIGDDAAVVKPRINLLQVLTTDILVENIHFRTDTHTPFEIGYKAIVANVSDVAAMAGLPRFALISLGLDPSTHVDFVEDFYRGTLKAANDYGLTLIGGDTTKSSEFIVNVVMIGEVESDMVRQRSGAQVGDQLVVTGDLGASAAGLYLLLHPKAQQKITYFEELKRAHLVPTARVVEARIAAKDGAHAMEDISDGLASEIRHICELSKVGAKIRADYIPLVPGVKEVAQLMNKDPQSLALYGGEDFELVFTIPKLNFEKAKKEIKRKTRTKITVVGEIVDPKEGIFIIWSDKKKTELTAYGYEHF
jgi:thiamine-monophosphate kinase